VHDGVDALERPRDCALIADVRLDDLGVDPIQMGAAPAGEVVQCANLDVPGQKLGDEIRPDEAACAGDESSSRNL
jgi:hypothetical protein